MSNVFKSPTYPTDEMAALSSSPGDVKRPESLAHGSPRPSPAMSCFCDPRLVQEIRSSATRRSLGVSRMLPVAAARPFTSIKRTRQIRDGDCRSCSYPRYLHRPVSATLGTIHAGSTVAETQRLREEHPVGRPSSTERGRSVDYGFDRLERGTCGTVGRKTRLTPDLEPGSSAAFGRASRTMPPAGWWESARWLFTTGSSAARRK